jgi:NADPH:quinone reductase-like Zn-dependent oxidoreductase
MPEPQIYQESRSMRAVVVHQQGDPSVLKMEQVPVPKLKHQDVLVRVRACALNHLDIWCRRSLPNVPLPIILGCDVAGEIAEVGADVSHIKIGQKVLVSPGISCGTCLHCLDGDEHLCRFYQIIGEDRNGGYAEYVDVPAVNCFPIPLRLDFEQAAAIPLVFLTAWHMLAARAQLKMGETVLVIGGGSGVGSAAIQIARLFHCRVITTVGSEDKAKLARELGAHEVINHAKQSIAEEIRRLTGKQGVDVIFEHVGPAVWKDCLSALAINGRLVTCGGTTGPKVEIDLPRLFMKQQSILGSKMGTKRELADMLPYFEQGLLKPVIDRVLPLEEVRKAHELIESRSQFGKIVLRI